jgi:hypothetical protein
MFEKVVAQRFQKIVAAQLFLPLADGVNLCSRDLLTFRPRTHS